MISYKYGDLPEKVDLQMIRDKMVNVEYIVRGTLTICVVEMQNGFKVIGESACVDPALFSQAIGEQYSFADAIDKLYALEGYLLADKRKEYLDFYRPKYPRKLSKSACGLIKESDEWTEGAVLHSPYYYDTDRNQPLNPVHDSEHI